MPDTRSMLVELSVVEQRYQAVLAVTRDGVPVAEVACRFEVSRQATETRYWQLIIEQCGLGSTSAPTSVNPPPTLHTMTGGLAQYAQSLTVFKEALIHDPHRCIPTHRPGELFLTEVSSRVA